MTLPADFVLSLASRLQDVRCKRSPLSSGASAGNLRINGATD
jgi:hypothetical protein